MRAPAALVIPSRPCAVNSLLALIRRASGVSSHAFYGLLPANTTSQSVRATKSTIVYSL